MICANILIYYLLVTCCCCGRYLQLVSAATSSSGSDIDKQEQSSSSSSSSYLSTKSDLQSAEGTSSSRSSTSTSREAKAAPAEAANHNHHNVHKLMSEKDLRRTFQVDSHDQVPEYEVLKLQVNQDGSHLISPISDLGELLSDQQPHQSSLHHQNPSSNPNQHKDQDQDLRYQFSTDENETPQAASRHKREAPKGVSDDDDDDDTARTSSAGNEQQNKLIVIDLSTFGKDFKLRLKRNADFQQRIKDMKMFMAESTQGGQLKYTEVSHPLSGPSGSSGKHKQEPHKRAANSDDEPGELDSSSSAASTTATATATAEDDKKKAKDKSGWNIGSTYHDEDNLAALLIDHDKKTGQLQIEGTIGNDFVIKPMPKATIEALLSARRRQEEEEANKSDDEHKKAAAAAAAEQQLASAESNSTTSRLDKPTANNTTTASGTGGASGQPQRQDLDRAIHMHDDDPHDDDEMFLDEDEAIELAQLQLAGSANRTAAMLLDPQQHHHHLAHLSANQTTTSTNLPPPAPPHGQLLANGSARTLSKAASERKWNKYRKLLLAQTQVPKIQQMAGGEQISSGSSQRARRHAAAASSLEAAAAAPKPTVAGVSHHIVFRQKPSSEDSSSAHQHSFMISPGSSMERLAFSFQPRRDKRDATGSSGRLMMLDEQLEADSEHDPLGGQFYLEPASLTGFERAGHSDWAFQARRAPYSAAFNYTSPEAAQAAPANLTAGHQQDHQRFKRHARPGMMTRGSSQVRRKRQAPDTVWPEVLLVVDYDSFLLHGSDSRDVKRYFVSFWNGVDLRYKLLVHPHIRISLAGMIVAKDRDATPYLERNRLRAPNADAVDAAGALTDMGKYLYREDRLPTYDLAVVITKLDMCRRRFEGGRCNRGTAGFAYVGGACVVNKRLEKVNSVAIIEDSGGFSGIIVAAHEVGHLLGCVHDGSPPPSYLGGPGATHCPWEDGFIMSDLRHTERGFRWSQCSVEQFKHFLNGETATCLYNYPHESQMLHRLLPGTMLSLDEQCKRDRGTNACFKDARVCAQLFCFDSASGYCVSYRPAAEGSPCGEGQVCRNGKCVGEIENIIPDYTHQSQTVVARGRPAGPGVPAHGLARLADNGLSASSTSTATSSPDSKPAPQAQPVISSRMDTYPIDSPLVGLSQPHYSGASYSSQFGGRYGSTSAADGMASSSAGVVVTRQRHPGGLQASGGGGSSGASSTTQAVTRSAKLVAAEPGTRHKSVGSQFQQRSGIQAPQANSQKSKILQHKQPPRGSSKQPISVTTSAARGDGLGASASSLSSRSSQQLSSLSQTTPTSSSSINSNSNLLANSHNNQLNHHNQQHYQPQPSASSIRAANSSGKQTTVKQHSTTQRHLTTTPHLDESHVNRNRKQSVNHRQAQYEPLRSSSSSSKAIYGSQPALYLTSAASPQYHPMSIEAAAAA